MSHIFKECPAGHDLTGKDAYLYTANGSRRCRACAYEEQQAKRKPKIRKDADRGAFQ